MRNSNQVARGGVSTTRTLSVVVVVVALSICAVWAHLPGRLSRPNAILNGSFNPLVRAEGLVKTGHADEALKLYRIVFTRAIYQGWNGASELIRRRLAGIGSSLMKTDGETAWNYFQKYALFSKDFNGDAMRVEALYLNNPRLLKTRFVYCCAPFGSRWINSVGVNWTLLWKWSRVPHKRDAVMPGLDLAKYRMKKWPVKEFVTGVCGQLLEKNRPFPTSVLVEYGVPSGSACVIVKSGRSSRVKVSENGKWSFDNFFVRPHDQIVRVLVFTDELPPTKGPLISIVHEYKPL